MDATNTNETARVVGRSVGFWATAFIAVGAVLMLAGLLMVWAQRYLFDSEGFSDRASASLNDPAVQERLAARLSEQIVEGEPDLAPTQPVIQGAAEQVIASTRFQSIFNSAVEAMHRLVFDKDRNEAVLVLTDAAAEIIAVLEVAAPDIADEIPPDVQAGVIEISESDFGTQAAQTADRVQFLAIVLPLLGIAAMGGGLWLAGDRRAAVARVGLALAVVAGLALLALAIGREVLTQNVGNPENAPAAGGIWDAFLDPFHTWMWVLGIGGLVVAAVAWLGGRRGRTP